MILPYEELTDDQKRELCESELRIGRQRLDNSLRKMESTARKIRERAHFISMWEGRLMELVRK